MVERCSSEPDPAAGHRRWTLDVHARAVGQRDGHYIGTAEGRHGRVERQAAVDAGVAQIASALVVLDYQELECDRAIGLRLPETEALTAEKLRDSRRSLTGHCGHDRWITREHEPTRG